MITLDDFSDQQNRQSRKNSVKTAVKNMARKEWSWEDLPEEINSLPKIKIYINEIKKNNILYNHFSPAIDIIEHGSLDLFKRNGKKRVLIAEGIKPWTAIYLMFELYRGVEIYRFMAASLQERWGE